MTYATETNLMKLWTFLGAVALAILSATAVQGATFASAEAGKLAVDTDTPKSRLQPALIHGVRGYVADGQAVVEWQTGSPAATIGFQVRRLNGAGDAKRIHPGWIAPPWSAPSGTIYRVVDTRAWAGSRQKYVVVERDEDAKFHVHGPFVVGFEADPEAKPLDRQSESVARRPIGRRPKADSDTDGPRQRDVIPTDIPQTVAKAFVRSDGLYRVTSTELAETLGQTTRKIETQMSRGRIAIRNQGNTVAWFANAENTELRFYGTKIDSRYTLDNVYWFELFEPATAVGSASATTAVAQPGGYFQSQAHSEEDLLPAINATKFEDVDYWYWDGVRAEDPLENRKAFPLTSPSVVAAGGQAELTVRLAGATKGAGYRYHNAVIYVNGVEVGSTLWMGLYAIEHTVIFDASLLTENNTIEIEGTLIPGAIGSAFFVDSFDLLYPRYYDADSDALHLVGETNAVVTVDGFSSPDAIVLGLANPNIPMLCDGLLVEADAGGYRVSFAPSNGSTPHLVTTESALLSVDRLEVDTFYSDPWQDSSGYDYVVIVPEALRGPAARLMAHRESQGLKPYLLVLEDLHDFYADGISDPWAVRDFLTWASANWTTVPDYVFLIGKGTFDPKDYLGHGDNLITPVMAATPYGMAASDNLLADIDGDRLPDFAIGRLPVLNEAQFESYVQKVIAYEDASGAWLDDALMLADDPDQAGDFTALSDAAITHLPSGMTATTVYLEQLDITAARTNLFAAWTQGTRLVNYVGHGGVDVFASETLLSSADMTNLETTGMSAAVSALSCVVGQFELPGWDALSESLLGVEDGGAVTMWAPTSPSYSGAAQVLNNVYFDELEAPGSRVGDAVLTSIQAAAPGSASFLLETYTLLGDPATRVR